MTQTQPLFDTVEIPEKKGCEQIAKSLPLGW
jgi:hypothetical protein